jgi:thymidylate kinase
MLKESSNTNDFRHKLQFKDELQKPKLGNLSTHTKEHTVLIEQREAAKKSGQGSEIGGLSSKKSEHTGFTLASARLMEKYVQDAHNVTDYVLCDRKK